MATIETKQGDVTPWIITLSASTGALNLGSATTVKLYARTIGIKFNRINGSTCAITTSSEGVVTYSPTAADVSIPGTFLLNYNVQSNTGTTSLWAASADYDRLIIRSNLTT